MLKELDLPTAPDPADDDDCEGWAQGVATALTELAMGRTPPLTRRTDPDDDEETDVAYRALLGYAGRLWWVGLNVAVRSAWQASGSGPVAHARVRGRHRVRHRVRRADHRRGGRDAEELAVRLRVVLAVAGWAFAIVAAVAAVWVRMMIEATRHASLPVDGDGDLLGSRDPYRGYRTGS